MSKEFEDKVIKCFENIDKRFGNVENILQNHTKILDEHTRILDEHTMKINNLHESVSVIENKVMTEFPALLEAFQLHQEMHQDLNEKISYLSVKTEENSIRISALEDKVKYV